MEFWLNLIDFNNDAQKQLNYGLIDRPIAGMIGEVIFPEKALDYLSLSLSLSLSPFQFQAAALLDF